MKKTKVICTLGPSSNSENIIKNLILNGMDVARFNFSHGDHHSHKQHIDLVKKISKKLNIPVAIMLDTKGPEMRLGKFKNGSEVLEKGQYFTLVTEDIEGDKHRVSINYKQLPNDIKIGDIILLSDGLIKLVTKDVTETEIITIVENTAQISSGKRVATPGVKLNLEFLSNKDRADILFAIKEDLDFIAASFVQTAENILEIKKLIKKHNANINIVAKIENKEGVQNIDDIIQAADAIMVARGDLGVELLTEQVPLVQKKLIKQCNQIGKPVIIATQMLESMTVNPRPTRAEASDVANAILDGADAVMLSGETASGNYPVEAMQTMYSIVTHIESSLDPQYGLTRFGFNHTDTTHAICHATVQVCYELNAKAIITATESGFTAQMVSKYRPNATIYAVTPHIKTLNKLLLVWGIIPIKGKSYKSTDSLTNEVLKKCAEKNYLKSKDLVVVTAGIPIGKAGTTNMIQVHRIE